MVHIFFFFLLSFESYAPPPPSSGELGDTSNWSADNFPNISQLTTEGIPYDYFEGGHTHARQTYNRLYNTFSRHPLLARSRKALQQALAFYARNMNWIPRECGGDFEQENRAGRGDLDPVGGIDNRRYIMIVDYTIPHPEDRFFVLDTQTGNVRTSPAAHGYGSNDMSRCPEDMRICGGTKCAIPTQVSNVEGSGDTSRGFYLTDDGYRSGQATFRNGTPPSSGHNALQLRGLQGGINSEALNRDVVFHRASYYENQCSNSAGCPAVNPALFEDIKDELGRSLMYIHTIDDEEREQPEC